MASNDAHVSSVDEVRRAVSDAHSACDAIIGYAGSIGSSVINKHYNHLHTVCKSLNTRLNNAEQKLNNLRKELERAQEKAYSKGKDDDREHVLKDLEELQLRVEAARSHFMRCQEAVSRAKSMYQRLKQQMASFSELNEGFKRNIASIAEKSSTFGSKIINSLNDYKSHGR